jgi:hypothetical protein
VKQKIFLVGLRKNIFLLSVDAMTNFCLLDELCDDVFYDMVQYLDVRDMLYMSMTCTKFKRLFEPAKDRRDALLLMLHKSMLKIRSMEQMRPTVTGLKDHATFMYCPIDVKSAPFELFWCTVLESAVRLVHVKDQKIINMPPNNKSFHMYLPHHFRFTFNDSTYYYPSHGSEFMDILYDQLMSQCDEFVKAGEEMFLKRHPQYRCFAPLYRTTYKFRGFFQGTFLIASINRRFLLTAGGFDRSLIQPFCETCLTPMHTAVNQTHGFMCMEYFVTLNTNEPLEMTYECNCSIATFNSAFDKKKLLPLMDVSTINKHHSLSGRVPMPLIRRSQKEFLRQTCLQVVIILSSHIEHPCCADEVLSDLMLTERLNADNELNLLRQLEPENPQQGDINMNEENV